MHSEEESNSLHPRFFVVILPQTLQNRTLEIPPGFVQEHGNCLSDYACLRVPNGSLWEVELRWVKGRVWLHKGWEEFVERYSVKFGYFLMFRYEIGCVFSVVVFDKTMMEIDYPVDLVPSGLNEVKEEDNCDDDDVLVEISDECPGKPRNVRELQLFYKSSGDQLAEDERVIAGTGSARDRVHRKGVRCVASDAKIKVLQGAKEFESKNPHFVAYMSESLISNKLRVRIPRAHFRRYLKDTKGKNVIVIRDGSNGRTWNIPYHVTKSEADRGTLGVAWRSFMSDNHLQVGDVCIFEMINRRAKTYNVTILRVADKP